MNPLFMFENGDHRSIFKLREFVEAAFTKGIKLYLTGSRFFGGADHLSDWDFYTEDSDAVYEWMETLKFFKETGGNYPDHLTLEVWRGYVDIYQVHIQIVKDVEIKHKAQEAIYKEDAINVIKTAISDRPLCKSLITNLWNTVITAVSNGKI